MGCGGSKKDAVAEGGDAPSKADAGKMTYFAGLRSRGEPTQIIAAYKNGVKMEVELIDFEEWGKRKEAKVAPYMPYITQPDGKIFLDTVPICKHLATLGGKFIVDEKTEKLCELGNSPPLQLADPAYNLPDGGVSLGCPPYDEIKPLALACIKDQLLPQLTGPFFAGAEPGFGEAFIWHNLDNWFALCKDEIAAAVGADGMGKLQTFYDKFAALDGIKEYLARRPKVWGVPGSKANPAA